MERQRPDGRWISVEGAPLGGGGWVAVYTDITQIKRQEQLLRARSAELSELALDHAERLAAANPHITAQAYDLNHFPALRDQYKVMSVPCLVVNHGQQVSFGKKSIAQLLDLLS